MAKVGPSTEHLSMLYRLSRTLHRARGEINAIMQAVVDQVSHMAGATHGCLLTLDAQMQVEHVYVLNVAQAPELWRALLDRGLPGFAYHGQRTIVIRNLATDPRWSNGAEILSKGSAIALPLMDDDRVLGVLILLHGEVDHFSRERVAMLEEAAAMTADVLAMADGHSTTLAASQARSDGFEDAVVPILLTDVDGTILAANYELRKFLGCEPGSLEGQPISTIHRAGRDPFVEGEIRQMQVGDELSYVTIAATGRGELISVLVRARRRTWRGREVIELVEQDLTAERELEQLRRDLSAMVYHDLRGPLQTIKGSMQKLAQILANHDNVAVLTLLQTGIRGTRQLRRMVDSLLDIQRLEEGNKILNTKEIDLRTLLADAFQLVQPLAMESGMRLKFDLVEDYPPICLDDDMILRVVTNLLENAIKFTPEGGTIILRAELQHDRVRIGISDTGPGIPAHMRERIFDKFSRVQYKDAPKGVGLGLTFCRLAVEAHQGEIWVESEPGNGAEFIFTLPLDVQGESVPAG